MRCRLAFICGIFVVQDAIEYSVSLASNAFSWASKRVGSDLLSSCETEFMDLILAAQEASYLGELQGEMDGMSLPTASQQSLWLRTVSSTGGLSISGPNDISFGREWS